MIRTKEKVKHILRMEVIMEAMKMEEKERIRLRPFKDCLCAPVPNWLMKRTEIGLGAKLAYARLYQFFGGNGQCFPTRRRLAKELGCSPRSVDRYLRELKQHKLIETTRVGKRCSNRYYFLKHEWMEYDYKPSI